MNTRGQVVANAVHYFAHPGGANMTNIPRRIKGISIRFSESERKSLIEKSKNCGITYSKYIRDVSLGAMPKKKITIEALIKLAEISRSINLIHMGLKSAGLDMPTHFLAFRESIQEIINELNI